MILEKIFEKSNYEFIPRYEVDTNWQIEEYVKRGIGMGIIIKDYVQELIDSGEFKEIKIKEDLPKRISCIAMRKNSAKYKIVKEFIKTVKSVNNIK